MASPARIANSANVRLLPFDLVPDFIPVSGQLDAIIFEVALRHLSALAAIR